MSRLSILHVDDEPDFGDLTVEFLQRADERLEVVTTTSADEGLDHLDEKAVDCVVSDYQMPGMDGIEFLKTIREEYPDLPFILFTGQGSEEVASEAIAAGVTDYLQKEHGTDQFELLANRITNAIERTHAVEQASRLERIRRLVRDVNQALLRASTRPEAELQVCEIVTEADPYCLALIAAPDPGDGGIEPRTAVSDRGSLAEDVDRIDDGSLLHDMIETALDEQQLAVSEAHTESQEQHERTDIVEEYDVRSVAAAPLAFGSDSFGVFVVCAERPFTAREQELLDELAGDITHALDAIETRTELAEERDQRAALFENTPDPIMEVQFDGKTPIITDVNAAFEETFGFETADAIGQPVHTVVVPDTERDEHESLKRRVFEGRSVETEVRRGTATGVREFRLRIIPIDVSDVSSGAYAWYTDITDRKERERELREAKERFQKIFEHSNDAIMVVDMEDETFLDVNPAACEMLDYEPEELLALEPEDIHPANIDRVREEFISQVLAEGSGWTDELECVTKEGDIVPTEISGAVLELDPDEDEPTTMVAVLRDISDREAYRRELERQVQHLDEFASIVSHDLRNPLRVAEGKAELLQDEYDSDYLDDIASALDRMNEIIEGTLTLARSGRTIGGTEPVDLTEIVEQCWRHIETTEADLRVEDAPTVTADPDQLRHVLENLCQNAITHGGEDVTVEIGRLADGFYVADDGPGIPEAERNDVFEVGYSSTDDGTGLGLAIVEKISTAHGWNIEISDSEMGGARFEITGVTFIAEHNDAE